MRFKVYFEFFGRKMRMEVDAISKEDAKNIVRNRIIFHEIKDDTLENIKNMFGFNR